MITLRKYQKSDIEHIMNMIYNRDLSSRLASDLPEHGYIATEDGVPIVVGFLRTCEGDVCMIDSLITNPVISSEIRSMAIDQVVMLLIQDARLNKFKKILAYSINEGILDRSETHGFKRMPHTLIGLDLEA